MLCEVDRQPVIVFVDREERDSAIVAEPVDGAADVHVYRTVRDGLVFYEVTPFGEPRVVRFLVVQPGR
jgi:hypothetical protein